MTSSALNFERYDAANPAIWEQFERITNSLIAKGYKHHGAKAIFEIIRYQTAIVGGDDEFKVNNNFTQCYARKFIAKYPEHKNFFEFREIRKKSQRTDEVSNAARILSLAGRLKRRHELAYPTLF